jgi:hypothetical protein
MEAGDLPAPPIPRPRREPTTIAAPLSVTEGSVTRDVSVRASSLARARRIAGEGEPGVSVTLTGPLTPAPEALPTPVATGLNIPNQAA